MLQEKFLLSAGSGLEIYRYIRVELPLPLGDGARLDCADRSALRPRLAKGVQNLILATAMALCA